MNAKQLIDSLQMIADEHNLKLEDISINFRANPDCSIKEVNHVEEDLYDAETSTILESITLLSSNDINQ